MARPTSRRLRRRPSGRGPSYAPILRAAQSDLSQLSDMTGAAKPITSAERLERIARAQALMEANDIAAVLAFDA